MKFLTAVCLLVAACLAQAEGAQERVLLHYHENVGIQRAAEIKQAELAADFDGSRIVGGSPAALGQYPYMGGLVITLTNFLTSVCGSTLISNTRLVTAAHCWWDGRNQARQFTVVLGSIRLFSGGTRINTNRVEMHGSWNPSTVNNDIAIITINSVSFNNNINSIGLASGSNDFAGQWAQAVGFGATRDGGGVSITQTLAHARVQVITNAACQQVYGPQVIVASTLCISGAGGISTCHGDSGGPLVANNHLIGVTSFGSNSGCQRNLPAGFARVTSFNSWIRARM